MKGLLCFVLVLPLIVSCSSTGGHVVREPAGAAMEPAHTGALTVYSATEMVATGDFTYSYPHQSYTIYRDGIIYRRVSNHVSVMDEVPMTVTLPAASYVIKAEDEAYGRVWIPVTVGEGQHITLNLERDWKPPANISRDKLIRLENGKAVGFVQ